MNYDPSKVKMTMTVDGKEHEWFGQQVEEPVVIFKTELTFQLKGFGKVSGVFSTEGDDAKRLQEYLSVKGSNEEVVV